MTLLNDKRDIITEDFFAQCTLCTILIGGTTRAMREETKRITTEPRKEQHATQWRGHTVCIACSGRIAQLGELYFDAFSDEIHYNIRKNMYRKNRTVQLIIHL